MAIKLFRKGNTHNINGIECEVRLFDVKYGGSFVGVDGWCSSPEDIDGKTKEVQEEPNDWDDLSSSDIREIAKESGIEGWENKRINTLKEVLSAKDSQD